MNIKEITEWLQKVSDGYADRFNIKRDTDWFVLKIQEELGELVSTHLKLTDRGRREDEEPGKLLQNLEDEIADVIAMTLLFARHKGIDVEEAIRNKWFQYLSVVNAEAAASKETKDGDL